LETVGKSVKSFLTDSATGDYAEVTNYPIRKRTPAEVDIFEKTKMKRKIHAAIDRTMAVRLFICLA
jgi:hypothetical protein